MNPEWLYASVRCTAAICLVAAIAETAMDREQDSGGLRMVCGLAAAASVVGMAVKALNGWL